LAFAKPAQAKALVALILITLNFSLNRHARILAKNFNFLISVWKTRLIGR